MTKIRAEINEIQNRHRLEKISKAEVVFEKFK